MDDLKIKPEFADVIIGFKNSGIPLGKRSQEDLRFLAEKAKKSPRYARYFEALPGDKDLLDAKGEEFLAKNPPVGINQTPPVIGGAPGDTSTSKKNG